MDKCLFKEWGVKNNRTDLLDRWDYEKNNRNIDDVCLCSRGKFWFRCENHDVHGSHQYCLASLAHNKESQFKCPICNSFGLWCIEEARTDLLNRWDYKKNGIDPFHKLNPFVCHRRKPTTFRWWEEPCESLAINPDSQYTFV